MEYLYTKYKHYQLFLEINKSNRLSKNLKIIPTESKISSLIKKTHNYQSLNEEIFDKPIDTDYEIFNVEDNFKKVIFKTNSNTEYRLDLFTIEENNLLINHISFTVNDDVYDTLPTNDVDFGKYEDEYEKLTKKNEIYEILNRIRFILKGLVDTKVINNNFCIGGAKLESKNIIYEYFLKIVVGDKGFEKILTNIYPTGWGLYFKI